MIGLGAMLATVEGSIFYDLKGEEAFVLPFYFNSSLIILSVPFIYKLIPNNYEINEINLK